MLVAPYVCQRGRAHVAQTLIKPRCCGTHSTSEMKAARADQPIPTQTNGLVQTVVAAATSVLRLGQLGTPAQAVQDSPEDLLSPGDVRGVLACIREDFDQHAYFITGDICDQIYDSQCFFADPTVKFSGLAKWKGNLKLLVPFLINPKIQLLNLEQDAKNSSILHAQWTLQTSLKLPWRPFLDVIGATKYVLNGDANQVVRHIESWNITPVQAIKQVLTPASQSRSN